jgi:hypothetical protein
MLMDPEDFLVVPKPDKHAIMVTLSEIYLHFKQPQNVGSSITSPTGPLSAKSLPPDVLSDAQDFERQREEFELKVAHDQFGAMKTVSGHHMLAATGTRVLFYISRCNDR